MEISDQKLRLRNYVQRKRISLDSLLGHGTDGIVWKTTRNTAVKVLERERQYISERESYRILLQRGVTHIGNFAVPRLVDYDDENLVVEMNVVSPPCIIDFGKVNIHHSPTHSIEVMEERERHWQEIWEDRWGHVQAILWKLKEYGIHYTDPTPNNIMFGKEF